MPERVFGWAIAAVVLVILIFALLAVVERI